MENKNVLKMKLRTVLKAAVYGIILSTAITLTLNYIPDRWANKPGRIFSHEWFLGTAMLFGAPSDWVASALGVQGYLQTHHHLNHGLPYLVNGTLFALVFAAPFAFWQFLLKDNV